MLVDPVLKSLGTRRPAEESTNAADGLGGGERLALTTNELAAVPRATTGATGSLEADAGVAKAMSESGVEEPVVLEEQATLPEASKGVVSHTVRQPSP